MSGRITVALMHVFAWLPLPVLRAVGWALGRVIFLFPTSRRKVALKNLELCFPDESAAQRKRWAQEVFVHFCQSSLDRSWVWLRSADLVRKRIALKGPIQAMNDDAGTIIFTPHFFGLDAAGTRLALETTKKVTSIYTTQPDSVLDDWMKQSRARFGDVQMLNRRDGIRPIISALRKGGILFLLPDMNFGPEESIFVPFFGVPAATVPSLSRFAAMGKAKVMPAIAKMTPQGYEIEVKPIWQNFPTQDVQADTALMNERLQEWIKAMPSQYFWVHKRFKTRPPGEPSIY